MSPCVAVVTSTLGSLSLSRQPRLIARLCSPLSSDADVARSAKASEYLICRPAAQISPDRLSGVQLGRAVLLLDTQQAILLHTVTERGERMRAEERLNQS